MYYCNQTKLAYKTITKHNPFYLCLGLRQSCWCCGSSCWWRHAFLQVLFCREHFWREKPFDFAMFFPSTWRSRVKHFHNYVIVRFNTNGVDKCQIHWIERTRGDQFPDINFIYFEVQFRFRWEFCCKFREGWEYIRLSTISSAWKETGAQTKHFNMFLYLFLSFVIFCRVSPIR